MTTSEYELLLEIGRQLAEAQVKEQQASEEYRRDRNTISREKCFHALQVVEVLTKAYVDATLKLADTQRYPTRPQPFPLGFART